MEPGLIALLALACIAIWILWRRIQELTVRYDEAWSMWEVCRDARDAAREESDGLRNRLADTKDDSKSFQAACKEVRELQDAIRKHRDAKGHNRCWLNDVELYEVLGESIPDPKLPELPEFMHECAAYWQGQKQSCPAELSPMAQFMHECDDHWQGKRQSLVIAGVPCERLSPEDLKVVSDLEQEAIDEAARERSGGLVRMLDEMSSTFDACRDILKNDRG